VRTACPRANAIGGNAGGNEQFAAIAQWGRSPAEATGKVGSCQWPLGADDPGSAAGIDLLALPVDPLGAAGRGGQAPPRLEPLAVDPQRGRAAALGPG
jgi:hypothetical protein